MSRSYHKLRSERHGLLELAGDGGPLPPQAAAARDLARKFIMAGAVDFAALEACIPGVHIFCAERFGVSFHVQQPFDLPVLPPPYGYKGGAARYVLLRLLHQTAAYPRDLDLLRIGTQWVDEDTVLSMEFMAKDFERGNGVELVPNLFRYFASRDISVNEVVVIGTAVSCSVPCLLDALGFVLRPCYYRSGTLHREAALQGRTLLKMLRLCAEGEQRGEPWAISGIPGQVALEDFELATELNKALFRGRAVAERFVAMCVAGDVLPGDTTLPGVVHDLSLGLYRGLDFFEDLPEDLRREAESFHPQ